MIFFHMLGDDLKTFSVRTVFVDGYGARKYGEFLSEFPQKLSAVHLIFF